MKNSEKLIKIFDADSKLLGVGHLLSMGSGMIKIKGTDLPILNSKSKVTVEIYDEFSGISPYFCEVSVASDNQMNVLILRQDPIIERRKSLKVNTDVSAFIDTLARNDEDITKYVPNMKINIINLSIGGMLISSNYYLKINDTMTFVFQHGRHEQIMLKAKVIRIDKIYDNITKKLSTINYGCAFSRMPSEYEAAITKYLFERQLQLYKNR